MLDAPHAPTHSIPHELAINTKVELPFSFSHEWCAQFHEASEVEGSSAAQQSEGGYLQTSAILTKLITEVERYIPNATIVELNSSFMERLMVGETFTLRLGRRSRQGVNATIIRDDRTVATAHAFIFIR